MVSFADVKNGTVSLSDLVGINHYLDMQSDIEYWSLKNSQKEGGKRW